MKQISICKIEYEKLYKDYIWSNFNMRNDSQLITYYRIEYKKTSLLEIRCTRMNDYSVNLEIGAIRIKKLRKALIETINFLKETNEELYMISTFIVSGDNLGLWMLKKVGFTVDAVWRECVEISCRKRDIELLSFECR